MSAKDATISAKYTKFLRNDTKNTMSANVEFATLQKHVNLAHLEKTPILQQQVFMSFAAKFGVDTAANGPSKRRATYLPLIPPT